MENKALNTKNDPRTIEDAAALLDNYFLSVLKHCETADQARRWWIRRITGLVETNHFALNILNQIFGVEGDNPYIELNLVRGKKTAFDDRDAEWNKFITSEWARLTKKFRPHGKLASKYYA